MKSDQALPFPVQMSTTSVHASDCCECIFVMRFLMMLIFQPFQAPEHPHETPPSRSQSSDISFLSALLFLQMLGLFEKLIFFSPKKFVGALGSFSFLLFFSKPTQSSTHHSKKAFCAPLSSMRHVSSSGPSSTYASGYSSRSKRGSRFSIDSSRL